MEPNVFQVIWFVLWGVLWGVYFMLDGFVLGTGFMSGFLAKNDTERRVLINTVGPVWDGNEVWLVTAGGVTFAAEVPAGATAQEGREEWGGARSGSTLFDARGWGRIDSSTISPRFRRGSVRCGARLPCSPWPTKLRPGTIPGGSRGGSSIGSRGCA